MAKKTDLVKAIEALELEIAVKQAALEQLKAFHPRRPPAAAPPKSEVQDPYDLSELLPYPEATDPK